MNATTPKDKNQTKQDYGTPDNLFNPINDCLYIDYDLAATKENSLCDKFITKEENSLIVEWHKLSNNWLWLNPEFKDIRPWAEKCLVESKKGANIIMLTPASVGSNWYRDFVYKKCLNLFLNGRLIFKGASGLYPKDCMLSIYSEMMVNGIDIWSWKTVPMFRKTNKLQLN